MKKGFFIVAVILMVSQNVFSEDSEKNITIQASPLLWFIDVFSDNNSDDVLFAMDLESQFKINKSVNFSFTVSFLINNHTIGNDYYDYYHRDYSYEEDVYQINFKPMLVFRPFETGIKGFYLGFYPNVGIVHVKNDEIDQFFTEFGFGIDLGYKWVFNSGFTMQLGGGIGKSFSSPRGAKRFIPLNSDGSIPTTYTDIHILDFKLGYSF